MELTPRQRAAVVVLADPARVSELKTLGRMAAACHVCSRTLRRWFDDPAFSAAIREEARRFVDAHLGPVYAALLERAQAGDVPAIRLVCEVAGVIGGRGPAVAVNVNEGPEIVLSWSRVEGKADVTFERDPETALLDAVDQAARELEGAPLVNAQEDAERRARERAAREAAEKEAAEARRREAVVRENLRAFEERKRRRFAEEAGSAWELGDPSSW